MRTTFLLHMQRSDLRAESAQTLSPLQVDVVLVLGHDRLYSDLSRDFAAPVSIVKLERSGGVRFDWWTCVCIPSFTFSVTGAVMRTMY